MLGEYIVIAIAFLMYFLPLAVGSIMLFIFFKKLGEKILDLVPVRNRNYSLMVPIAEKILIRKRVIDLKNKTATEVSLEATPEQVRAIFRN